MSTWPTSHRLPRSSSITRTRCTVSMWLSIPMASAAILRARAAASFDRDFSRTAVWTIALLPELALVVTLIMLLQRKLVDSREYILSARHCMWKPKRQAGGNTRVRLVAVAEGLPVPVQGTTPRRHVDRLGACRESQR